MEEMINKGEMMEFGEFKGNLYGTALSALHLAATKVRSSGDYGS